MITGVPSQEKLKMQNTKGTNLQDYTRWLSKEEKRCLYCRTMRYEGWAHSCEATRLKQIS